MKDQPTSPAEHILSQFRDVIRQAPVNEALFNVSQFQMNPLVEGLEAKECISIFVIVPMGKGDEVMDVVQEAVNAKMTTLFGEGKFAVEDQVSKGNA